MADIGVQQTDTAIYRVTVTEADGSTLHEVTAEAAALDRLGAGSTPEQVIEASFRFLLDREPKESILSRFHIEVISRYFPEFPAQIGSYL